MKDEHGNPVASTPIKRRKISQLSSNSTNILQYTIKSCESMIVLCRNLRIGTLCRIIKEPVVFCVDHIKIVLEDVNAKDGLELILPTSQLTKCEWCSARKLPVVYFQSTPCLCKKLQSRFQMSRENEAGWYDCNATSIAEQYIVLIFDRPPEAHEIVCFERIQSEVGEKQLIPNFFSKISFEEANRRLVASTNHGSETPSVASTPKDHITRSAISETRMKLRNTTPHLQFFEDDEEEGDTHTVFVGPIVKLFVYPPPPAKGGISVTNEDLHCLNEGEFLNDVIIDFYLKYLVLEKLREKADRIHIFSSFFYKRLNQRERRNLQDTANLTLQQRRHGRVKTWTRHVDIFQKDFIFVPLNEAAHWFLAVICFPGLNEPMYYPNEYYQETSSPSTATAQTDDNRASPLSAELRTCLQSGSSKSTPKKLSSKKQTLASGDTSSGTDDSDSPGNKRRHNVRKNDQGLQESDASLQTPFPQMDCSTENVNGIASECKTPMKQSDGLHRIKMSYSDSPDDPKKSEEELIDSDQDNLDESSDDGGLADDNFTSEAGKWHLKRSLCKQGINGRIPTTYTEAVMSLSAYIPCRLGYSQMCRPCILIMDSLRGPSRSNVVKTLREYLEVEWEVKKGSKRSFSKDYMKGSNPRVPQQNNFSDCGVFVLQYNPIQSFDLPMNLTDWFPQQRMKTKREEIRNLILGLQELQSKDKTGQRDLGITQPTPQEGTEQLIGECDRLDTSLYPLGPVHVSYGLQLLLPLGFQNPYPKWAKQLRQGILDGAPPGQLVELANQIADAAIASLLKAGVIVRVPGQERFTGFYSNLFVVPKKDGKVRPILDLKLLNKRVHLRHFRMESLRSVMASMEAEEFLCSIDIQDAYLHVPIFPGHHRFLLFAVLQDHFKFVALPFGLATAPRVSTKIMAALIAILKRFVFLGMLFDTRQTKVFLPEDKTSILRRDVQLLLGSPPSDRP
ncbi:unnamed protein product [Ranitomeya imitator]|uniref:ribonuclease H n=1 Tax=Ranitomeya imitator TaxID=111125 RepID=A0ABN9L4E5_9NEOB|nr:unnamed protein product [Ranitomeya imitator]